MLPNTPFVAFIHCQYPNTNIFYCQVLFIISLYIRAAKHARQLKTLKTQGGMTRDANPPIHARLCGRLTKRARKIIKKFYKKIREYLKVQRIRNTPKVIVFRNNPMNSHCRFSPIFIGILNNYVA